MKVHDIVSEAVANEISPLAKLIFKNCQPYLQATAIKLNLYRGLEMDYDELELNPKLKVNKRRTPRNTKKFAHALVNKYFHQKFSIKFRSTAVFATGDDNVAAEYGNIAVIYPIGNFDYCWSPVVDDLTVNLLEFDSLECVSNNKDTRDEILAALNSANYRCNVSINDFRRAINSGNELMINCNNYYAVPEEDNSTILKQLRFLEMNK